MFRKGAHAAAYSGFEGADDDGTPLADWLRAHDVDTVDVVGIATDYCVRATAADAAANGFSTRVLLDLTAGVAPGTTAEAITALRDAGVEITPPDRRDAALASRTRQERLAERVARRPPVATEAVEAYRYTPMRGEHQHDVAGRLEQAGRRLG